MRTIVTVIVDNTGYGSLAGEWGLSFLIKHSGKTILYDMGASNLFALNMEKLGFDIEEVDYAALSHAHYDHGNGIPYFFEHNSTAPCFIRETTSEDCYFKKMFVRKYIGLPKQCLKNYEGRIQIVSDDFSPSEGAYLIPHKTAGLEKVGKRENMYRRTPEGWMPDSFSHEQSLVLDTESGLVILNSCSHGGAAVIVDEVRRTFPGKEIGGYIGGLHLFNKTDEEVRKVACQIKDSGISFVCTGHCTKEHAYGILKEELGDVLSLLHVGLRMEF